MRTFHSGIVAVSSLLALAGCHHAAPGPQFDPSLNVNLKASTRLPDGLYYRDITVGSGDEAKAGELVAVEYVGWLTNGKQFDATQAGGAPYTFQLGAGRVIKGWDEGVAGMKVGGRRQLIIPAELGYGATGTGGGLIPPNATLVFVVDLVGVKAP